MQAGPLLGVKLIEKTPDHRFAFVEFCHAASIPFSLTVMEDIQLFDRKLDMKPRQGSIHEDGKYCLVA